MKRIVSSQLPLICLEEPTMSWQPGRPIKPEETSKLDLTSAWRSVGPCYAAAKYDGYRLQIHRDKDRVWLYTRNLKDWTKRYPYVVEAVQRQIRADRVILDGELIARVLQNLIGNAIKFTPAGGTITIAARQVDGEATVGNSAAKNDELTLRVSVTDSGPGVPPEFRDKLFQKFVNFILFYNKHCTFYYNPL